MLSPTVVLENVVVSHIAYADDLLILCHTRSGLTKNLNVLFNALSMIEVSVNASKCEFLCLIFLTLLLLYMWVQCCSILSGS